MVKKLIGVMMLLCGIFTVGAQELPLNPNVRHGQLPNGLNYYLLHNEEPKGRANFYIAQKVGSSLETPKQLGLAHFLEHMAFNGTTHFPGKQMLEYLQHKGIRFGADINAYTGFDETVYNVNNVPCADKALMDSVLLVLHDWSCDLSLEDAEIDSERGVIHGEWRQRNDADNRMMTAVLPQIYEEYQYHQMPIGSMDVVLNFPYQDLRDYYHKWYRPDQQGIIIVGDFDVNEMENKVKELFTPIKMPENPAPREYPMVSDNKDMIYASFEDPELQNTVVRFSIKMDKTPFEKRNSLDYYIGDVVVENLIQNMINSRLAELSQKPDCAFSQAVCFFGNFWVAKTKDALNLFVVAKNDAKAAFEEAYKEVVRACRTGFTASELNRVKDDMLSGLEKQYNERDKTNSNRLAQELIRKFIDNEPAPGVEVEWNLCKELLPAINVDMINQAVSTLIKPDNQVMVLYQPKVEGKVLPTRDEMLTVVNGVQNSQFEAYVDNVINEPLIAKLPKKGSIKSQKELPQYGATELTLSNGVKVFVKTTDFASDEIGFRAVAPFGTLAMSQSEASNAKLLATSFEISKLGKFDVNQLTKALAGKHVTTSYFADSNISGFSGSSTKKDLETLMQLIYLQFTNVNPDPDMYAAVVSQMSASLLNNEKNPDYIFSKEYLKTLYDGNLLVQPLNIEDLSKADYTKMLNIAKDNLKNAADYDFIFVGNVDVATLKPYLEQYIASLPGNAKKLSKQKNALLHFPKGHTDNKFDANAESEVVKEFVAISGEMPYSLENDIKLSIMGDILDMIYIRTLREELGGTYGAYVQGVISPRTNEWMLLYGYDTNAKQRQELDDRAVSDLKNLMENGANADDFNKVKGAALAQAEISAKKNGYWISRLTDYAILGLDKTQYKEIISALTLEDLNKFMKTLYNGKNRIHVVLNGVATK